MLITTGSNWHALLSIYAAKAGKDVYCEKPCSKTIVESLALADAFRRTARVFQGGMQRRNLPHFEFAAELARQGKLGKLQAVHAHPGGLGTGTSGFGTGQPEPPKDVVDWDMFLGSAAWRPLQPGACSIRASRKGAAWSAAGAWNGAPTASTCANGPTTPTTRPRSSTFPIADGQATARYANGVKLVVRNDGWLPLGSCPVRYEGCTGWVETGDSGKLVLSSPALLAGKKVAEIGGYPATFHIRDFLDCVKSRGQPRANAQVACQTHIACHAVNIAVFLNRKLAYDPRKNEFLGDEEANRLRGEAIRDPWRL